MTLREWLLQHHSENCFSAGWSTKRDLSNPDKYVKVAELWLIPIELLNMEVLSETRKPSP